MSKQKFAVYAFDAVVSFFFEEWNETYKTYDAVNAAEEKSATAQKLLQRSQLSWMAGRSGA